MRLVLRPVLTSLCLDLMLASRIQPKHFRLPQQSRSSRVIILYLAIELLRFFCAATSGRHQTARHREA